AVGVLADVDVAGGEAQRRGDARRHRAAAGGGLGVAGDIVGDAVEAVSVTEQARVVGAGQRGGREPGGEGAAVGGDEDVEGGDAAATDLVGAGPAYREIAWGDDGGQIGDGAGWGGGVDQDRQRGGGGAGVAQGVGGGGGDAVGAAGQGGGGVDAIGAA